MLRNKMMQDLRLAGYAPKTQKTYLECIGLFAQFCWEPAQADQDGVRAWVAQLDKSKVGPQRLRQHFAALKFLFGKTLARPEQVAFLSWPKAPKLLPTVLSASQVGALLGALESPKYRVFFTTLYATGLRLKEACHLKIMDSVTGTPVKLLKLTAAPRRNLQRPASRRGEVPRARSSLPAAIPCFWMRPQLNSGTLIR